MTQNLCPTCHRPSPNTTICTTCTKDLASRLRQIPGLLQELELTALRQTRINIGQKIHTNHTSDTLLPFNPPAAEHLRTCTALLDKYNQLATTHIRLICIPTGLNQTTKAGAIAKHLTEVLPHLTTAPFLGDLHNELTKASLRAIKLIDLPLDKTRFYVGPCPELDAETGHCIGDIWAWFPLDDTNRPMLKCNECETQWYPETWLRLGTRIAAEKQRRETSYQLANQLIRKTS